MWNHEEKSHLFEKIKCCPVNMISIFSIGKVTVCRAMFMQANRFTPFVNLFVLPIQIYLLKFLVYNLQLPFKHT